MKHIPGIFRFQVSMAVLLLTLLIMPSVYAQMEEPTIRVGILSGQHSVIISSDADAKIMDANTGQTLGRLNANDKLMIIAKDKDIIVNGKAIEAEKVSITTVAGNGEHFIEVNKRQYRGLVEIHHTYNKSGLTIVNILPVEQYLYGTLAKEISTDWPLEAVKAQAVAARSYALANKNKYQNDGYDVSAGTDCQVYGGRDSESAGAVKAVNDTYGQVISYQGKFVSAFFHASSGGYTENSENVWSTYTPYMRGVVDYDQNSPHFKWEKSFAPKDIADLLLKSGYNIGELKAIELSPLTPPPVSAPDRGISGRVKNIRFIGSLGMAQIDSGEKLRRILSLNSSLIDLRIIIPVQSSLDLDITDSAGDHANKRMEINLPPVQEKEFLSEKSYIRHLSGRPGETVVISGYGWGHGLGLSQWGAKAMAEKAPQGDATYFKQILKHYYQGVEIQKVY